MLEEAENILGRVVVGGWVMVDAACEVYSRRRTVGRCSGRQTVMIAVIKQERYKEDKKS
jgi:hypothetical protein